MGLHLIVDVHSYNGQVLWQKPLVCRPQAHKQPMSMVGSGEKQRAVNLVTQFLKIWTKHDTCCTFGLNPISFGELYTFKFMSNPKINLINRVGLTIKI